LGHNIDHFKVIYSSIFIFSSVSSFLLQYLLNNFVDVIRITSFYCNPESLLFVFDL
jgi:hypothetical protein